MWPGAQHCQFRDLKSKHHMLLLTLRPSAAPLESWHWDAKLVLDIVSKRYGVATFLLSRAAVAPAMIILEEIVMLPVDQ